METEGYRALGTTRQGKCFPRHPPIRRAFLLPRYPHDRSSIYNPVRLCLESCSLWKAKFLGNMAKRAHSSLTFASKKNTISSTMIRGP